MSKFIESISLLFIFVSCVAKYRYGPKTMSIDEHAFLPNYVYRILSKARHIDKSSILLKNYIFKSLKSETGFSIIHLESHKGDGGTSLTIRMPAKTKNFDSKCLSFIINELSSNLTCNFVYFRN